MGTKNVGKMLFITIGTFIMFSCAENADDSRLNPKPIFDQNQQYADLWRIAINYGPNMTFHVQDGIDDQVVAFGELPNEGFCAQPAGDCYSYMPGGIGPLSGPHGAFKNAVTNGTYSNYFSDEIWDEVFIDHTDWLTGLRNGTLMLKEIPDTIESEFTFAVWKNTGNITIYLSDIIFAIRFDESGI